MFAQQKQQKPTTIQPKKVVVVVVEQKKMKMKMKICIQKYYFIPRYISIFIHIYNTKNNNNKKSMILN